MNLPHYRYTLSRWWGLSRRYINFVNDLAAKLTVDITCRAIRAQLEGYAGDLLDRDGILREVGE